MSDDVMTLAQAADYLGYDETIVDSWMHLGLIRRRKRDTALKRDLDRFMNLSFEDMLKRLEKHRDKMPKPDRAYSKGFQSGMVMALDMLRRAGYDAEGNRI